MRATGDSPVALFLGRFAISGCRERSLILSPVGIFTGIILAKTLSTGDEEQR
jgi:hypothetical protein